jgi:hypothetical protein
LKDARPGEYDVARMSPRDARVTRNQELFREVNLHIAGLGEDSLSFAKDGLLPLVCECAHTGCMTPIEVDRATFEQVRENRSRFLVKPGHDDPVAESVVERRGGYLIIETDEPA